MKDHLRRAGIAIRPGNQAKLSETDKDDITALYKSGLSIHTIALQFGVTDNPVHNALKERGVGMRDPHGRVLERARSQSRALPVSKKQGAAFT